MELQRIREVRGLTQAELSRRAQVSTNTISRLETGRSTIRSSNARRLLDALQGVSPLSPAELRSFCEATGLEGLIGSAEEFTARVKTLLTPTARQGMNAEAIAIASELGRLTGREARLMRWISAMIEKVGVDRVEPAIRTLASALGVDLAEDPPDVVGPSEFLTVSDPPAQREGYVEQVKRHYETTPGETQREQRRAEHGG